MKTVFLEFLAFWPILHQREGCDFQINASDIIWVQKLVFIFVYFWISIQKFHIKFVDVIIISIF